MAYATQESIRDRVYALIESLIPTTDATRFRRYRNEWGADFAESAEKHPDASLRRFQVRQVDSEEPPEVSSGLEERVRLALEIRIAYPQSHRYGRDGAMDRDDVIRQDMLKINSAIGIYGRANFSSTHDCTPLGATPDRETGQAVDFLIVRAEFEYLRQIAVINTTLTATLTDSSDPLTADGGAFMYTLAITNSGSVDANSVTAVVTLPAEVGYTSATGTGWNISRSGQTVTCSRATLSTGAAPSITINCTAPSDVGDGSITATAEVSAANVITAASASQVTTLKAPYKIVALFGQSNAMGRADVDSVTIRSGYADPYPGVMLAHQQALSPTEPLVWIDYGVETLRPRTDDPDENFGPELSMGRFLDTVAPGEYAIAQISIGGAGLNDHLRSGVVFPSTGDNAFTQIVDRLQAMEIALNGTIEAFVFVQGETDAATADDAAAYEANLTQYIADMRAASPAWADVPFIFNRLSTLNSSPQKNTIRAAQTNVAAAVTGTTMVNCDDLVLPDNVHFSADGYVLLGERFALAVLDALGYTVEPPQDATSGKYMPTNVLHWRWLIEQFELEIDPPWDSLSCQEESAGQGHFQATGLHGTWGNLVLTANANPLYQQTISGWATKGVGFVDNTANQRFRSGQTTLPNLASESVAVLANIAVLNDPAAVRDILGFGSANDVTVRIAPGPVTRVLAGNSVTSALPVGDNVRPYVAVIDRTATTTRLYTDQEQLAPAWSNVSGQLIDLGASVGAQVPPTAQANQFHIWRGASAEKLTAANTKAMLQALGWPVSGY